jgi:hypothetical protein
MKLITLFAIVLRQTELEEPQSSRRCDPPDAWRAASENGHLQSVEKGAANAPARKLQDWPHIAQS